MRIILQLKSNALTRGVLLPLFLACALSADGHASDPLPVEVSELRAAWDDANFVLQGDDQKRALLELVELCPAILKKLDGNQSALTWCGIVNSSYAGRASALSAMKYAKAARAGLEAALELPQSEMTGIASTSLGALYFKVPGWPIGFGDEDKARELLEAGLQANPEDLDANFFMADFLIEEDELEAAQTFLEKAAQAPIQSGREKAYEGRQKEIVLMRADIEKGLTPR